MSQQELLKKTVEALNNAQIDYFITGSIVSSIQGEPRLTHDIDIVADINFSNFNKFITYFNIEDYYYSFESIISSIETKTMFNIIDSSEGDKVDLWILKNEEFDHARNSRKYKINFGNIEIYVTSAEDTIISKLLWSKKCGGSIKHYTDALKVFEIMKEKIDMNYIKIWVEKLNIQELWKKILLDFE